MKFRKKSLGKAFLGRKGCLHVEKAVKEWRFYKCKKEVLGRNEKGSLVIER